MSNLLKVRERVLAAGGLIIRAAISARLADVLRRTGRSRATQLIRKMARQSDTLRLANLGRFRCAEWPTLKITFAGRLESMPEA
jgi:hypothetical protein